MASSQGKLTCIGSMLSVVTEFSKSILKFYMEDRLGVETGWQWPDFTLL
jgi:hypothetical protein